MRRLLSVLADWFTTAPLDLGLREPVPAAEVEAIVGRVKVRECKADSWDAHVDSALSVANEWLSDEDLLGLVSPIDFAPARAHEGTAVERGWTA